MTDPSLKKNEAVLLDELYRRYATEGGRRRWIYLRKKWAWLAVVQGAKSLKRFLDVCIALSILFFFLPLWIVIISLIWLTDQGSVLYISKRVGKWGKEFSFYKFRSMHIDADKLKKELLSYNQHQEGVTFKIKDDPRITWIGKILRRTSLDEVPQLINVLKGDMSLVGPRPPLPEEVEKYSLEERRRLDVAPGITCIWQVSGRSEIPFSGQVRLDLEYIESRSVWGDIKLLIRTIPAVILGKGAY